MGLAQVAEQRQHVFPLLSSWFSLPSCGMLLCWEMQPGKGLGVCSECCELPWGVFQLQRGCWVDLCVFEGVFESVSPGQGHPLERRGQGTCEGKSSGE